MLPILTKVVVKPGLIKRLFGIKSRPGFIAIAQIGKYSKEPVYTILFDAGGMGAYFENELGVVIPITRTNAGGVTLH